MSLFGRRRRILIDRLQFTLLGVSLLHLVLIVGVFLVAIFTPVALDLYDDSSAEISAAAATEFLNLHARIWPAAGLALLLIGLHSLHVSHRIAGPLYRFRKVFDAIARGDLTQRAGVRSRDYLEQDAVAINRMIEGLAGREAEHRERANSAKEALTELEAVAATRRDAELTAAVGRLGLCLDGLGQSVRPEPSPLESREECVVQQDRQA
jgi:methyl-accepting chemotaxis protein